MLPVYRVNNVWLSSKDVLNQGDIILLVNEKTQRSKWPMARVTKLLPGMDGLVRNVKCQDAKGRELYRNITKIIPLLKANQELSEYKF